MSPPSVSAVMIVRDGERFLAEAIESVLAQEYPALELVARHILCRNLVIVVPELLLTHDGESVSSNAAAAAHPASFVPSSRARYRAVVAIFECPSTDCTSSSDAPDRRRSFAAVCRNVCTVSWSTPIARPYRRRFS